MVINCSNCKSKFDIDASGIVTNGIITCGKCTPNGSHQPRKYEKIPKVSKTFRLPTVLFNKLDAKASASNRPWGKELVSILQKELG